MDEKISQQVKELSALSETRNKSSVGTSVFVLLVLISGMAVFGYAAKDWFSTRKSGPTASTPNPTSVPTTTAAPTKSVGVSPTPAKQSLDIKIQVQNGSGIPGLAGVVKELLTTAGYVNVSTANASSYDYESTVIMVKENTVIDKAVIQKIIEKSYTIDAKKNILDAQSEYDVVIIVGKT